MNEKAYYPALTGFRAVAAYMVYLHHYNTHRFGEFIYLFFNEFRVGVPLFFVLSGFLITLRYHGQFSWSWQWLKVYFVNRLARIYPSYFLITTLVFVASFAQMGYFSWKVYLLNISFLRGFFQDYKWTGIAQGWSLTVEETFYFLAPLIFVSLRKVSIWIQAIMLIVFGIFLVQIGQKLNFHGFFANYDFLFTHTFFGRCTEFFIGIQFALWFKSGKIQVFQERYFKNYWTVVGILGTAVCFAFFAYNKYQNPDIASGYRTPLGLLVNASVLPIMVAILLIGLITERNWVVSLLSSTLFQHLGRSSYAFYLIHMGILWNIVHVLSGGIYLIDFLGILGLSFLMYKFIEQPYFVWIKQKFQ